jgi:hypothetical protein
VEESHLHNPVERYDDRSAFLYFLLGIVSLSEKLSAILQPDGAEQAHTADGHGPKPGLDPDALRELLR